MEASLLGARSFEVVNTSAELGDYLLFSCKEKPGWEFLRSILYLEPVADDTLIAGLGPVSAHYNTIEVTVDYGEDEKQGALSDASYFYQLWGKGITQLVRVKFPTQLTSTLVDAGRVTATGITAHFDFLDFDKSDRS